MTRILHLMRPGRPHCNSIPFLWVALPCAAGNVDYSIGEQPNAEPPETTQHSRPSTGHEQYQASSEREREQDPGDGHAKCRGGPTSTAQDPQCKQREQAKQHVQKNTPSCYRRS